MKKSELYRKTYITSRTTSGGSWRSTEVVGMTVNGGEKKLTMLRFRFGNIDWERATAKQYELLKDGRVWRAFLNGYAKNGYVVFDEEALPKEELLESLKEFEPTITEEKHITVAELIESSYSWNNVRESAKS